MLGNDIVDFQVDEAKYHNPRFIQRVLTEQEQHYLAQSQHPNRFLWSLWAAKEACFKALQRNKPQLTFSPITYKLSNDTLQQLLTTNHSENLSGEVNYKQQNLSIKYQWPEATVVHCLACVDFSSWPYIDSQIAHIENLSNYQQQSQAVRTLAQRLLKNHGIEADIIRPSLAMPNYDKPGPPILVNAGTQQPLPAIISLSHDNNYLAAALYCHDFILK